MVGALTVGVDIGGTKIAFLVANRDGDILEESQIPTLAAENSIDTNLDRIAQQINAYVEKYPAVEGIGIAVPGPVDNSQQQGIVLNAVNLGWKGVALKHGIASRLIKPLPMYVENDINTGAIGEYLFGIAKQSGDFVYIAIGTGLGGAAMINHNIIYGASSAAMEVGHMSLDPHGRLCTCGLRGCVEMSISGKGLVASATERYPDHPDTKLQPGNLTTYEIIRLAKTNDPLATAVIEEAAQTLGITCGWCTMIFNPRLIVLGGGLSHALFDLIEPITKKTMQERTLPQSFAIVNVTLSRLTNAALGASALVWYYQQKG